MRSSSHHLPVGWDIAALGDVTTDCEQRVPKPSDTFTYIDIASVDRGSKTIVAPQVVRGSEAPSRARKVVRTGDTVVSMTRPNLNAVALVPRDLEGQIASTGFDVLRPIEVDPRWVFYAVRSQDFVRAMSDLVQGALYPAVRPRDVRAFETVVAPLPEQNRIADKLDTLLARVDACRERLDRAPAILKRFRQSVLAAATSGELTRDWRERNAVDFDWSESTLNAFIERIEAGINVQCEERPPAPGERGLVKISAVTWGVYDDSESKTLQKDANVPEYTRIKVGDLLISRANTLELVGACVIVHEAERPVYLSDKVLRLVVPEEWKRWLLISLQSPAGRNAIESRASGNQLSMRNLSQSNLRQIPISVPTSSERDEIDRRVTRLLELADKIEKRVGEARTLVESLVPATLAKAFRGELVPQDPNDEPAAELLARIRLANQQREEAAARNGSNRSRRPKHRRSG